MDKPKYSEDALVKVCFAVMVVILAAIAGISHCVGVVLNKVT